MDTIEWITKISSTLGDARKELSEDEFLVVLAYIQAFTAKVFELETAGRDKHLVAEAIKYVKQGVDVHIRGQLRTVGIEL